jgi:hypothetical protein
VVVVAVVSRCGDGSGRVGAAVWHRGGGDRRITLVAWHRGGGGGCIVAVMSRRMGAVAVRGTGEGHTSCKRHRELDSAWKRIHTFYFFQP